MRSMQPTDKREALIGIGTGLVAVKILAFALLVAGSLGEG
jgi:hypothetical protein